MYLIQLFDISHGFRVRNFSGHLAVHFLLVVHGLSFFFHTTVNYHIHTFANILRCYIFFCYFTDEGTWKSTKNICTQHWWFHRGWAILQPDNIGPTSKGKGNTTTSFFDSFAWYSCNQKVNYCCSRESRKEWRPLQLVSLFSCK